MSEGRWEDKELGFKMRVQCDVCERNKAAVMCCADEAALCTDCDIRVHAANKLAHKHVRVPLLGAVESPRCDICQVCVQAFVVTTSLEHEKVVLLS